MKNKTEDVKSGAFTIPELEKMGAKIAVETALPNGKTYVLLREDGSHYKVGATLFRQHMRRMVAGNSEFVAALRIRVYTTILADGTKEKNAEVTPEFV